MLIVHGAVCCWWDSIDKVGSIPMRDGMGSLPCCPFCKGVLFQIEEADWWAGVKRYEDDGHPGYRKFVEWFRGKCYKKIGDAYTAYYQRPM